MVEIPDFLNDSVVKFVQGVSRVRVAPVQLIEVSLEPEVEGLLEQVLGDLLLLGQPEVRHVGEVRLGRVQHDSVPSNRILKLELGYTENICKLFKLTN